MSAEITAFLLLSVSGLFQAAFAVPIKHLRNWRWEQVWVAQSVMANILLPLAFVVSTWLIRTLAPDAEGHGTEKVIAAIHAKRAAVPAAEAKK